jgi:hypothetical protein
MDISIGKESTLYLQGRSLNMAIGPELKSKADVFFTTKKVEASVQVDKFFEGAGEYEVQGVMVDGVSTGGGNTSYHITTEGVTLAAVVLDQVEDLDDQMLECLEPADILVLWLKAGTVQEVAQLMSRFDAHQLIPAQLPCQIDALEKELQLSSEKLAKLKLNAKNYVDGIRLLTVLGE